MRTLVLTGRIGPAFGRHNDTVDIATINNSGDVVAADTFIVPQAWMDERPRDTILAAAFKTLGDMVAYGRS